MRAWNRDIEFVLRDRYVAPQFGAFFIYLSLFGFLLLRPGGLLNRVQEH